MDFRRNLRKLDNRLSGNEFAGLRIAKPKLRANLRFVQKMKGYVDTAVMANRLSSVQK